MAQQRSGGVNRFYILLGAIALIGAGTLAWLVWRPRSVSIPVGVAVEIADTSGFRGYLLGSETAPVEVTEYADFQCPACKDFETVQFPTVRRQLIETGMVRWRYRDFPLDNIHPNARLAAHAAACADEQGKYWELHKLIYDYQDEWARRGAPRLRELARDAGVRVNEYDDCMASAKYAGRIEASFREGQQIGVPSTPTFLIGGRLYPGSQPSDSIRAWVQRAAASAPAPAPPPPAPPTP